MNRVNRVCFVVRVVQDLRGEVSGVIERVATGAKEPFTDVEAIGQVIRRMLPGEQGRPRRSVQRERPIERQAGECLREHAEAA